MSEVEHVRFTEQRLTEIDALVKKYPAARSALLPVLHMAQEDFGYLPMPVQQLVADTLGLRLMIVREVVTFYTMFREHEAGKYRLEVCTNAGCMLNGADELVQHITKSLGIDVGETTADGMFTVTEVECAGACSGAPVVQINNEYHEKVDAAYMDAFITKVNAGVEGDQA
ncbi:MAG: NAD(P)H-dependent oxidoreductase subunit E [Proteobacteria bacterium]|nr:MAG: NAD(P)H-dependent oxidoreductase subunit E [Pseudomonadota bacterium]